MSPIPFRRLCLLLPEPPSLHEKTSTHLQAINLHAEAGKLLSH